MNKNDLLQDGVPTMGTTDYEDLVGATGSLVACAASGAYTYTPIRVCSSARHINLFIRYDAAASSGRLGFFPVFSNATSIPAAGDAVWYAPTVWDGVVTTTSLAGAVPSGADYTGTPAWGLCALRRTLYVLEAASAGTDDLYDLVVIPARFKFFQIAYAEHGVTGSPGSVNIKYSLSA